MLETVVFFVLAFTSSIWGAQESPWYGQFELPGGCVIKHMCYEVGVYDRNGQVLAQGKEIECSIDSVNLNKDTPCGATLYLVWDASPKDFYANILAFIEVDKITPSVLRTSLMSRLPRPTVHRRVPGLSDCNP